MHQKPEFNGFDNMGGIADPNAVANAQAQNQQLWNELEQLIHQVFEQNPQGKQLLSLWKEALIMSPTVTPNSTAFQVGIEEGKKEFIRNIYLTIKSVEAKQPWMTNQSVISAVIKWIGAKSAKNIRATIVKNTALVLVLN